MDSKDLLSHIVSAVASDDGMKEGLAAEGVTLVDLAAVKLTLEASAAPAPVPIPASAMAEAEISEGVPAWVYFGGGVGVAALVGGLVTEDRLRFSCSELQ